MFYCDFSNLFLSFFVTHFIFWLCSYLSLVFFLLWYHRNPSRFDFSWNCTKNFKSSLITAPPKRLMFIFFNVSEMDCFLLLFLINLFKICSAQLSFLFIYEVPFLFAFVSSLWPMILLISSDNKRQKSWMKAVCIHKIFLHSLPFILKPFFF